MRGHQLVYELCIYYHNWFLQSTVCNLLMRTFLCTYAQAVGVAVNVPSDGGTRVMLAVRDADLFEGTATLLLGELPGLSG